MSTNWLHWLVKRWVVLAVLLAGLLVLVGAVAYFVYPLDGLSVEQKKVSADGRAAMMPEAAPSRGRSGRGQGSGQPGSDRGTLNVKKATLRAQSDSVGRDFAKVRAMTERYGGYVESSDYSEGSRTLRRQSTLRMPSDRFDTYLERLQSTLDVESLSVTNYRISIEASLDEIDVLQQTLEDLKEIKGRIDELGATEESIDLLMTYNNRRLDLVRDLRRYRRRLARSRNRSRYATVSLTLTQEKPVEVTFWPEDLARRWSKQMARLGEAFSSFLVETPVTIGILLIRTLQYLFYALTVLLPFLVIGVVGWSYYRS